MSAAAKRDTMLASCARGMAYTIAKKILAARLTLRNTMSASFKMPEARPIRWREGKTSFNVASLDALSSRSNYGCKGKRRRYNELFDDGMVSDVVWQGDVYHYASSLNANHEFGSVLDIGCGTALKTQYFFGDLKQKLYCVDIGSSFAHAKTNTPSATHLECNATTLKGAEKLLDSHRTNEPCLIILSDVIEHLTDPLPCLYAIRRILERNPRSRAIISTPDRERLGYKNPDSLPANPHHIREWTLDELIKLLVSAGFSIERQGHCHANSSSTMEATAIIECSFDKPFFNHVLERYGLPSLQIRHLYLTTEYPGLGPAGGIGTFVRNQMLRDEQSLCLHASAPFGINDRVVSVEQFLPAVLKQNEDIFDRCLIASQLLAFLYGSLQSIEFQDYLGIGFRVTQAAAANLLPIHIETVVHCHGNQLYLENAFEEWGGYDFTPVAEREKITIEWADKRVFPSTFLRDLYIEGGYNLPQERTHISPYWHPLLPNSAPVVENEIHRLVFLGKMSRMKGFDVFLQTIDNSSFVEQLDTLGIRSIEIIGGGESAEVFSIEPLKNSNIEVKHHSDLSGDAFFDTIKLLAPDTLFVAPYRADNFPIALLDVISAGGTIIAGQTGGVPEMLVSDEWSTSLFPVTVPALQSKITELLAESAKDRVLRVKCLQRGIVENNTRSISYRVPPKQRLDVAELPPVAVMIPFFNTDLQYVKELFAALNCQLHPPVEVIIVNDCSQPASRDGLQILAETHLHLPYRIIDHGENLGLAGARNTALSACSAPLIANIDSDDIPLPNWLQSIAEAFSKYPDTLALVPYLEAFDDGTDLSHGWTGTEYIYRAMGEGYIICQVQNLLGHANSGFNVKLAKAIGGWNQTYRSKYEDWEFYLRAVEKGHKIQIVPTVTCLYRVRIDSMVRTYGEWQGQQRLGRSSQLLPTFESIQLQRLMRSSLRKSGSMHDGATTELESMRNLVEAYRRRLVVRATDKMAVAFRTNSFARLIWRITRKIRA